MKKITLFLSTLILLGFSCKNTKVHSYYTSDTLHILSDDGKNEIAKLYLRAKYKNCVIRDPCFIQQFQDKDKLFVAISEHTEIFDINSFYGLFDLKTKSWIVKQRMCDTVFVGFYQGTSDNNKYHLFVDHTSNDHMQFKIFDSNNKVLKYTSSYFPSRIKDENYLKWQSGNELYYYALVNQDSIPNNLPNIDEYNEKYARKYLWINGKDSITNDFQAVNVE